MCSLCPDALWAHPQQGINSKGHVGRGHTVALGVLLAISVDTIMELLDNMGVASCSHSGPADLNEPSL